MAHIIFLLYTAVLGASREREREGGVTNKRMSITGIRLLIKTLEDRNNGL